MGMATPPPLQTRVTSGRPQGRLSSRTVVVWLRHLRDELEVEVAQQDRPDGRNLKEAEVKVRIGLGLG